ncbi:MFS transporter [Cytobacillus sp. IB215316]|uniref:MFS transporter n=1 Tax=Cytobacillus sp. IB215316 TaxID=3097354 RepID=UPI002A12EAC2|nr:MFS transporter [Cytobacillus sp. IB215316]MDX8361226.1 MFS transporter [Cytobacillus sp. IB215316]
MNKTNLILLSILIGTFLVPVNSTMIAVGLPSIASYLNVSITDISWVVTIYLIVMAVVQPIAGKLGDLYGNKQVMQIGFIVFLISSIACAFSFNLFSLILFRSLQALGGALLTPNATAIIRFAIPTKKLSHAFGIFGLTMGLGAAIGPLLGSFLIRSFSWEAIFWVNIPFLVIGVIATWLIVPNVNDAPPNNKTLDIAGTLYLGAILTFITLFATKKELITGWTTLVLFILVALFSYQELVSKAPLIEFSMFKNIHFTTANLFIMINNFFMYSTVLFIPISLNQFSISTIGMMLFYFALSMSLSSWIGGTLANMIGKEKVISISFFLCCITALLYFTFSNESSYPFVVFALIFGGFSSGIGIASMQINSLKSVPREKVGIASGIYSTFRYLGGIMASLVVAILIGNTFFFLLLLCFSIIGLILSLGLVLKNRTNLNTKKYEVKI